MNLKTSQCCARQEVRTINTMEKTITFSSRTTPNVYNLPDGSLFHCCFTQKELSEKQTEMVKTVTAAENAINKLQLNTVSIEVNTSFDKYLKQVQVL